MKNILIIFCLLSSFKLKGQITDTTDFLNNYFLMKTGFNDKTYKLELSKIICNTFFNLNEDGYYPYQKDRIYVDDIWGTELLDTSDVKLTSNINSITPINISTISESLPKIQILKESFFSFICDNGPNKNYLLTVVKDSKSIDRTRWIKLNFTTEQNHKFEAFILLINNDAYLAFDDENFSLIYFTKKPNNILVRKNKNYPHIPGQYHALSTNNLKYLFKLKVVN